MQDFVSKGNGDSRYLKSVSDFLTRYPTYEDMAAALVAGTLPIDLNGINSNGIQQRGTPYNKANVLTDATAAKLGLTSAATPNDAFNKLADGSGSANEADKLKTARAINGLYFDGSADISNFGICDTDDYQEIKTVNLIGYKGDISDNNGNPINGLKICVKFTKENTNQSPKLSVVSKNGTMTNIKPISVDGVFGFGSQIWGQGGVIEFQYYNGYWYVLGGIKRHDTFFSSEVSYSGTGMYGSTLKTTVKFPFLPDLIIIKRRISNEIQFGVIEFGDGFSCYNGSYGRLYVDMTDAGSSTSLTSYTISFYNTENANLQLNTSGVIYSCFAFKRISGN